MNCKICAKDILLPPSDFLAKASPSINNKSEPFDLPSLCIDCRLRRRLAFRNERFLFHRECAATKKKIISVFPPNSQAVIFQSDYWRSDAWDARDYAQTVNLNTSVFEQFGSLFTKAPLEALYINDSENSEYTNFAGYNKNTYLLFNSGRNQDCYYSRGLYESQDCCDMYYCQSCQYCYECINCNNCYNLQNSEHCAQCHDSYFLHDCVGCSNCIACVNLRHQQYQIFNQTVTKAEFEAVKQKLTSYKFRQEIKKKYQNLLNKSWQRGNHMHNTENSSGDFLSNCNNCHQCFESYGCQDAYFCDSVKPGKDLYACIGSCIDSEFLYETIGIGKSYRVAFTFNGSGLSDVFYSAFCQNSKNLFACVGIKNAEYCIFNKQYSKAEYFDLLPKLINQMRKAGEWGTFFDPKISHYNYNQTVAFEYFPCARDKALNDGYIWREQIESTNEDQDSINASDLPDQIQELNPDMRSKLKSGTIRCLATGDLFRITKAELLFYESNNIPLPKLHPEMRYANRTEIRGIRKQVETNCSKCSQKISISASKASFKNILCERCFTNSIN